jgi:AcrR family transcriptional regulator
VSNPPVPVGSDPAPRVLDTQTSAAAGHPVDGSGDQAAQDSDRSGPLTRERVLRTALAFVDAHGVEALSMRRLANELGRDPMRLYRHADSKSALLDAVTELVLAEFVVPESPPEDWETSLRSAAHSFRAMALSHPRMVPLLVTRPLSTPLGLRPVGTLRALEDLLRLFGDAGFGSVDSLHAYRLFIGFLQGHVLNEVQELVENSDETDVVLRLGLYHLPIKDFPRVRAVASHLAAYDGERELAEGLDFIIGGLRSRLVTPVR